jgi:ABC-type dipeptide/oligopeptide/nickel transport system permease component
VHYHHLATRDAAILRNRLATTASVFAFALALALIITFGVKFHLQDVQEKKNHLKMIKNRLSKMSVTCLLIGLFGIPCNYAGYCRIMKK